MLVFTPLTFASSLLALDVPNKYKDAFLTAPPSEYQKYEGWGVGGGRKKMNGLFYGGTV